MVVKMKLQRAVKKCISLAVLLAALLFILVNFNAIFPALNRDALALSDKVEENPNNIPESLNFISDDKKAFVDYCQNIYGANLPLAVSDDSFEYYGSVNGYRLYRMQATLVPIEPAHQSETLDGCTFESGFLFRPSKTGLYLVGSTGVYSLSDAYSQGLVNVREVYKLYHQKSGSSGSSSAAS